MAELNDQGDEFITSYFPDPPPFYKNFTTENQERLQQFKDENDVPGEPDSSGGFSAAQLLSLPPEVRYLVPPEPPVDNGMYTIFNRETNGRIEEQFENDMKAISEQLDLDASFKDWKYTRLYPNPPADQNADGVQSQWTFDRQTYLKRFVRSILLNYLELLGVLANDPTSEHKDAKLRDILDLVTNAHALVNEYRPHQARETLINMMEDQLEEKKAEIEGVRQMKLKVEETLADLAKQAPDRAGAAALDEEAVASPAEKRIDIQRHTWQALDEILGH